MIQLPSLLQRHWAYPTLEPARWEAVHHHVRDQVGMPLDADTAPDRAAVSAAAIIVDLVLIDVTQEGHAPAPEDLQELAHFALALHRKGGAHDPTGTSAVRSTMDAAWHVLQGAAMATVAGLPEEAVAELDRTRSAWTSPAEQSFEPHAWAEYLDRLGVFAWAMLLRGPTTEAADAVDAALADLRTRQAAMEPAYFAHAGEKTRAAAYWLLPRFLWIQAAAQLAIVLRHDAATDATQTAAVDDFLARAARTADPELLAVLTWLRPAAAVLSARSPVSREESPSPRQQPKPRGR